MSSKPPAGVYAASLAIDAAGNLDMAIAIEPSSRGSAGFRPARESSRIRLPKEYAEAESKAAALFRAIDLARTCRRVGADSQISERQSRGSR